MAVKDMAEWVARELATKERAYSDGNLGALRDVISLCGKHNKPLPGWATKALLADNADMLLGLNKKGEGRHSKWCKKYVADMKDLERYEWVLLCREHNIPWKNVYDAVAMILKGTYAAGGADTMKKAYARVIKRQDKEPGRYHTLRTVFPGLTTAQPLTPERAEMWAKVRRFSKTPEKIG